ANPSIAGRNPQIQGTGNFILTTAGVLATTPITSVVFEFGTGPDSTLPGVPVPERFSLPEWCLLLPSDGSCSPAPDEPGLMPASVGTFSVRERRRRRARNEFLRGIEVQGGRFSSCASH